MEKLKKFMVGENVLSKNEMKHLKGGANWLCFDGDGNETCVEASAVVHNPNTNCYSISIPCELHAQY